MATLTAGGQLLMLLPEKCIFLPESDTLLVADVHIGKAVSFRALGVPVPGGTTGETLALLTSLVRRLALGASSSSATFCIRRARMRRPRWPLWRSGAASTPASS